MLRWALISMVLSAAVLGGVASSPAAKSRGDALAAAGQPIGGPAVIDVSPPPAVRAGGGRELAEFEAGRKAVALSGCLACHRIAGSGNRGPGRDLTHVGSVLSRARIERALTRPPAPMPSFKRLPRAKFHDIVVFLSLLRR